MFLTFSPHSIIDGRGRDWLHLCAAAAATAQVVRPRADEATEAAGGGEQTGQGNAGQGRGALKGAIDGLISSESSIHPSIHPSIAHSRAIDSSACECKCDRGSRVMVGWAGACMNKRRRPRAPELRWTSNIQCAHILIPWLAEMRNTIYYEVGDTIRTTTAPACRV